MPVDLATAQFVLEIVSWLAKRVGSLRGPSEQQLEELEADILHYLAERKEWTTPGFIWAELVLLPILKDVRFEEAFPPSTSGWPLLRWRLKNFRVNVRHRWRMWRQFIPKGTVAKLARRLWREGRLRRAAWDELYQVRYD